MAEMTLEQQREIELAKARAMAAGPKPTGGWTPQSEADIAEKVTGTGTFADMTGSGIARAIPFGDEIVSGVNAPFRAAREWMQGEGFDVPRAYDRNMQVEAELQKRRDERSPIASTVGSVAGGIGATAPLAAGGLSFLNGAKPTIASLMGRGAAEGASYGAVYGAGEGRGLEDRALNAATGAGTGAVAGGAVGALARIGAGGRATSTTVDDLKTAAQQAYRAADNAGVVYRPEAIEQLGKGILEDVVNAGYHPQIHPKVAGVLNAMERFGEGRVGLQKLEQLRRIAGSAAKSLEPDERRIASIIIDNIDNFTQSMTNPSMVATGDSARASAALREARDYWGRARKLETVENLLERGKINAGSSGTGANLENATRQQLKRILTSDKMKRGFTPDEQEAIRKAVLGSLSQNTLRQIGRMAPGTGGLSNMLWSAAIGTAGGATGGLGAIPVAALGGTAMGARAASGAMSRAAAQKVADIIATGGLKANVPMAELSAMRKAIVEALTRGSAQQLPAYTSP